jgi:UPF0271 protein
MRRRAAVDLNADVGEGCGFDEELVPLVSSVNIACGAHAGDLQTMKRSVGLALGCGAAIGAHPGFEDREHFGRRELPCAPREAALLVVGQTRLLQQVASGLGARVGHVKLHGALYNMASRDRALASAVVAALAEEERLSGFRRVLVALAGSVLFAAGRDAGLAVIGEAFADRSYLPDGSLAPRAMPGAVIKDEDRAAEQALLIARDSVARTIDGGTVPVDAGTICIHGDSPKAVAFARRIRRDLLAAGIAVGPGPGR